MSYKCEHCRTVKQHGEKYWRVKIITYNGRTAFVPACSEYCAEQTKNINIELRQLRVEDIKNQSFQIREWEIL